MVEHLLAQGPGLNSPALGKMERKRKNESRREGKARGDQVGKVDTGYWGGGLGRYGSAGVGTSRWGQYTMSHSHNASHFL